MTKRARNYVDELRGASRLAIEATRGVTDLVEAMHHTIAGGPELLGRPLEGAARLVSAPIYAGIRGVTESVGAAIDLALGRLAPLVGDGDDEAGAERDALLAVVNGVLGDYLEASGNPLAIPMQLCRHDDAPATGKLVVLVHGSCLHDRSWRRRGHDHGAALARDLGFTPYYLRYNSGLHISTNGAAFAAELEALVDGWPLPLDELVIVGHSMGGLVARSACAVGEAAGHRWRRRLGALVCLGAPHHGALLERGGNWIDRSLGVSRYSAPLARLGRIRSAGVTDLRHGNVRDEDWQGHDRFAHGHDLRRPLALPDGVACYAIAATTATRPAARLPGDGLVTVDSALGRHADPARTLAFPEAHQWIGFGMGHLDLLGRPEVYATLRGWLDVSAR
ncbi:MAG TPA: alpha/beta hydrolase [Polyangia bacterium]